MVKKVYGSEVSGFVHKNRDKYMHLLISAICTMSLLVGLFLGLFFFVNKNAIIVLSIVSILPLYYVADIFGKKLDIWRSGGYGEREVFVALKYGLSDSYILFSDLAPSKTRTNVDLVVVGPTGIFAIEIKNDGGKISFDGDKLLKNGKSFDKKCPLIQAKEEAALINNKIIEKTGLNKYVTPVVVFSNEYSTLPQNNKVYKNCYVVFIRDLFDLISDGKNTLNKEEIEKIERALKNL